MCIRDRIYTNFVASVGVKCTHAEFEMRSLKQNVNSMTVTLYAALPRVPFLMPVCLLALHANFLSTLICAFIIKDCYTHRMKSNRIRYPLSNFTNGESPRPVVISSHLVFM